MTARRGDPRWRLANTVMAVGALSLFQVCGLLATGHPLAGLVLLVVVTVPVGVFTVRHARRHLGRWDRPRRGLSRDAARQRYLALLDAPRDRRRP